MENLLILIMIFALALFLGYELITKIPPTLHTPLMSGSSAISGIVIIGSIIILKNGDGRIMEIIGFGALILSTINVVGGFLVTDRMLGMFKKKSVNNGSPIVFKQTWNTKSQKSKMSIDRLSDIIDKVFG